MEFDIETYESYVVICNQEQALYGFEELFTDINIDILPFYLENNESQYMDGDNINKRFLLTPNGIVSLSCNTDPEYIWEINNTDITFFEEVNKQITNKFFKKDKEILSQFKYNKFDIYLTHYPFGDKLVSTEYINTLERKLVYIKNLKDRN